MKKPSKQRTHQRRGRCEVILLTALCSVILKISKSNTTKEIQIGDNPKKHIKCICFHLKTCNGLVLVISSLILHYKVRRDPSRSYSNNRQEPNIQESIKRHRDIDVGKATHTNNIKKKSNFTASDAPVAAATCTHERCPPLLQVMFRRNIGTQMGMNNSILCQVKMITSSAQCVQEFRLTP